MRICYCAFHTVMDSHVISGKKSRDGKISVAIVVRLSANVDAERKYKSAIMLNRIVCGKNLPQALLEDELLLPSLS